MPANPNSSAANPRRVRADLLPLCLTLRWLRKDEGYLGRRFPCAEDHRKLLADANPSAAASIDLQPPLTVVSTIAELRRRSPPHRSAEEKPDYPSVAAARRRKTAATADPTSLPFGAPRRCLPSSFIVV